MSKTEFRNPGKLPHVNIVSPKGSIRRASYGKGIVGRVKQYHDGKVEVERESAKVGWVLLSECYEKDPRPEIQANGLAMYRKWDEACERGIAETSRQETPDGGFRDAVAEFPREWLPEEVTNRLDGKSAVSTKTFSVPKLSTSKKSDARKSA